MATYGNQLVSSSSSNRGVGKGIGLRRACVSHVSFSVPSNEPTDETMRPCTLAYACAHSLPGFSEPERPLSSTTSELSMTKTNPWPTDDGADIASIKV